MSVRVLNVAVCGAGIVGGGVINLIKRQRPLLHALKLDFRVKTLLCRDPSKARDFLPEAHTVVTADPSAVLSDPSIDIVVEAIGGTGSPARDLVFGAAAAGKHVVTANKALLAAALPEVRRAFPSKRVALGYEASVAGGVPVIRALTHSLLGDSPTSVSGILNGTTNYILTAMAAGGRTFAEALAEAQAAGFAESDPSGDVEGHDARNKLVLLTQLAYGVWVPPAQVRTAGIAGVTPFDVAAAAAQGFAVKLLGVSRLFPAVGEAGGEAGGGGGGKQRLLLDAFVSPSLVPLGAPLAGAGGAANHVNVDSPAVGRLGFSGPGAGRDATATSILADMVSVARGTHSPRPFPRPPPARVGLSIKPSATLRRDTYVRAPAKLADLLSVALWRQGRSVTPFGAPAAAAAAAAEPAKAFCVNASAAELESLVARGARKVGGASESAVEGLAAQVACFPVVP
jgi:homoserine dehydrogenase